MPEGEITPPADAALPDNSDAEISDEGKEEQGQDQQQNQDQQQIQDQQQGQGQAQEQSDGKDDLQPQEGEAGALPSDDPAVPITVELSNDGQQDAFPKIGWPGEMGVDLYSSPTLDAESHLIVAGQEQELLLSGYADSAQEWYELTYLNESWYTFVKDVLLSPPENVEEETPQTLSLLQPSLLSMAVAPAAKPGFPCDAWIDGAFGADLYSEPTLAAANHLVITDAALPLTLLGYAGDGEEWYQLLYQEETWYAPAGTLLLEAPEKDEPAESPVAFAMPAMTMLAAAPAADTDTVTVLLKKNTDGLVYSHIKLSRQAVANGTQDPRVILTSRLEDLYCDVYPASEWDKLATLATDTQTEYSLTIARRNTYNTVHTEIACQNGTEITTLADYYEGLSGLDGEQVALNYTELVRQTPLGFRPVAQTAPVVTLDSSEESIDTEPVLVVADSSPSTDEKYFAYHIIYYEWDDTTTNFFTVSNRKSTVSAIEPDTVSSTINSDSAWKAETSANWITLSSRGEGRGQSTLAITATNNISFSSRKAIITVKNATGSIAITVSQAALENGLYIFSEDGKLLKASNDYKPIPSQYISSNKPLRLKIISNLDWSAAAIEYIATPEGSLNGIEW